MKIKSATDAMLKTTIKIISRKSIDQLAVYIVGSYKRETDKGTKGDEMITLKMSADTLKAFAIIINSFSILANDIGPVKETIEELNNKIKGELDSNDR